VVQAAPTKLNQEAGRKVMAAWSVEAQAESNRCLSAAGAVARERLKRLVRTETSCPYKP